MEEIEDQEIKNKYLKCNELLIKKMIYKKNMSVENQFNFCTFLITIINDSVNEALNTDPNKTFEFSINSGYDEFLTKLP